jgi:hypothetical protein
MVTSQKITLFPGPGRPFEKWTFLKCPKSSSELQTWKINFYIDKYL